MKELCGITHLFAYLYALKGREAQNLKILTF